MVTQLDAFDVPAPYVNTDTSIAAAVAIQPHSKAIRERVFRLIQHGLTTDQVEEITGLSHQTASPRVRELAQANRIKDSGERRKTRSGRNAIVWVVA